MLWGALNNASQAMMATSWDMGSISQNIANVNTTGYKRKESMFKTLLSETSASAGGVNIFTVRTADRTHIQAQGVLTPSGSATDLAINGRGFFMVSPAGTGGAAPSSGDLNDVDSVFYTRDGSWSRATGPDSNAALARNYFTNGAGQYLLGWMADDNGNISPNGALQPVYTLGPAAIANNGTNSVNNSAAVTAPQMTMPGRATTAATLRATLPADAPITPTNVTQTQIVTDPNTGQQHTMSLTWDRVDATNWTVTPSIDAGVATITSAPLSVEMDCLGVVRSPAAGGAGIDLTWTSGATLSTVSALGTADTHTSTTNLRDPTGALQSVTLDWTRVSGNIWTVTPTVPAGLGSATVAATTVALDSSGRIVSPPGGSIDIAMDWNDATYGTAASTTPSLRLNSPPAIGLSGPAASMEKIPIEVFDSLSESHDVIVGFERVGTNQWYAHTFSSESDFGTTTPISTAVNFLPNGAMDVANSGALTGTWGWPNGGSATVAFDIDGINQFAGTSLTMGSIDQDGFGNGVLLRNNFNDVGELEGFFSNGKSRTLFKVPIAQFISENNLESLSGNLFRRTREAGDVSVFGVEDAVGEPRMAAGMLETSTVDIGEEFTRMIMTQKAYSTNATVFRTADEMTTTVRDLRS